MMMEHYSTHILAFSQKLFERLKQKYVHSIYKIAFVNWIWCDTVFDPYNQGTFKMTMILQEYIF